MHWPKQRPIRSPGSRSRARRSRAAPVTPPGIERHPMKYIASIRPIGTQRVSASDSTFEDLGNQPHSELGRFVAWLVGSDRDLDALSPDDLANLFAEYA